MAEGCCPSRAGLQELFGLWQSSQREQERRRDLSGRREAEVLDTWRRGGRVRSHPGYGPETDLSSGSSLLEWAALEERRAFLFRTSALMEPRGVGSSRPAQVSALRTPGLAEQVPEWFAAPGGTSFRDRVPQVALTERGQVRWYGKDPTEAWSPWRPDAGFLPPQGRGSTSNQRSAGGPPPPPDTEPAAPQPGDQCVPIGPPVWGSVRDTPKGDQGLKQTWPIERCIRDGWRDLPWPGTWPPSDSCVSPCVASPSVCTLPDDTLDAKYNVRALTDAEIAVVNSVNGTKVDSGLTNNRQQSLSYIRAAVRFLVDNRDLAEWAVCMASAFNPMMTPEERSAVSDYLGDRLTDGLNVYVVGRFTHSEGSPEATAGATAGMEEPDNCAYEPRTCPLSQAAHTCDTSAIPREGYGVVVAANHPHVLRTALTYAAAKSTGQVGTTQNAVRYVIWMAGVILHELLHLYYQYPVVSHCTSGYAPDSVSIDVHNTYIAWDQTIAPDSYHCWRNQAQAQNNFTYAAYIRFGSVCSFDQNTMESGHRGFEWAG